MSEPVYRRDEAGRLIEVTPNDQNKAPEARGKAAALSRYLAKKGSPSGKRLDRHVQRFERMWAKAPGQLKDKYARQSATDLAPIERPAGPPKVTNATLNAAAPGETTAQVYARQRASRTKPPVAPPAAAPSAFAELTKPVPVPAGGVNSVGNGEFAGGVPMNMVDTRPVDTANKLTGKTRAEQAAVLMDDAKANPPTAGQKVTQSPAPPSPNLPPSAPPPAKPPGMTMTEAFSANDANPFMNMDPAVDAVRDQAKGQAQAKIDAKAAADAQARNQMNAERAKMEATRLGVAPPIAAPSAAPVVGATQPTPAPVRPPGQSEAGSRSINGPKPMAAPSAAPMRGSRGRTSEGGTPPPIAAPAAPTGAPIMGDAPKGVNRLTGLPFGFRPGDALPKADAQTQQRAADSVARQSINQAQATPPIAPPKAVMPSATDRYADAQNQYQAGKAPAAAMDKVYAGASGIDQAKITAQSLKRASSLPRPGVTPPPLRRPILAR